MLRFRIAGLPLGQFTEQRQVAISGLDLSAWPEFSSPVTVDLEIEKSTESIMVTIRWQTDAEFFCDRCAEAFTVHMTDAVYLIFTFDKELAGTDDENIFPISESTQEVDMSEPLRQSLILALPVKRLCREDCRGLCPECGANWNTETCNCSTHHEDSRWDKLKQLVK